MAVIYTQTANNATPNTGVFCSGAVDVSFHSREAIDGGTPSSTAQSASLTGLATNQLIMRYKCLVSASTVWNAGTWTVRFNVTVANMNILLTDIYICRVNSSDVNQATIGASTGLAFAIGTTGVKTGNVIGSAQTPSVGDYVFVILVFSNTSMTTQGFSWDNSQNIDSPFDVATVFIPPKPYQVKQAVNRASTY